MSNILLLSRKKSVYSKPNCERRTTDDFGVAISFIFVIMMLYWLYKKHLNLQQNQIHEIK